MKSTSTMLILPRDLIRQLDADAVAELGMPSLLLMENAACSAVQMIVAHGPWRSITIVCGRGNNGGDGLAVCRLLGAVGVSSHVLLMTDGQPLSSDAAANLQMLRASGKSISEASNDRLNVGLSQLDKRDLVIDGLLGTGLRVPLSNSIRAVIETMNDSRASILALDVPSGLDCDSGQPLDGKNAVRAWRTVTFAALKQGFVDPASADWTGEVSVGPIGIPESWLHEWARRHGVQVRSPK